MNYTGSIYQFQTKSLTPFQRKTAVHTCAPQILVKSSQDSDDESCSPTQRSPNLRKSCKLESEANLSAYVNGNASHVAKEPKFDFLEDAQEQSSEEGLVGVPDPEPCLKSPLNAFNYTPPVSQEPIKVKRKMTDSEEELFYHFGILPPQPEILDLTLSPPLPKVCQGPPPMTEVDERKASLLIKGWKKAKHFK